MDLRVQRPFWHQDREYQRGETCPAGLAPDTINKLVAVQYLIDLDAPRRGKRPQETYFDSRSREPETDPAELATVRARAQEKMERQLPRGREQAEAGFAERKAAFQKKGA